ncbi:hypothetical protein [Qipengyuania sediminis]|uniref:hypothetical protein n=1 Tax=Qipengyuania sediminis TaxID=1532023 RepID=UPI0014049501|nr:hypothetical protein [Qipengyuania sediminis]
MIETTWSYRGYLQAAIVLVLFTLALRRGGAPEKWGAGTLLTAILFARLHELAVAGPSGTWTVSGFATDGLAYLAIDVVTFLALAVIGLKANRIYPLWMAGVQLTALLTHIAERVTTIVSPLAYAILNLSTFYLATGFLAAGLVAHIRRAKAWGQYPDWRRDLYPSQEPTLWRSRRG